MDNILSINGLSKSYGSIQAVSGLNIKIPAGSVFGILGPNGSGKTTTLAMILGVIKPDTGDFSWFGKPLNFETKKRLGAILETPNFYPYMSGRENLKLVSTIKGISNTNIDGVLETVNLKGRAESKFKTYSLGMKQRLAIASALLSNPEVLVLDEPTNGLDPQGIAEIRDLITRIAQQGITVIIASHLLDEVEKVCTHTAVLRFGHLLFCGTVDELTGNDGMVEVGAENIEGTKAFLETLDGVDLVKEENGLLLVLLNKEISPAQINKQLTQNGIYAHHLVFRKNSLEKQFLNLISNS